MTVLPRRRRTGAAALILAPAVTLPVTVTFAVAGFVAPWNAPRTAGVVWAVTWQLVVGLGCATAGHAVTAIHRTSIAGRLLILAALTLFAAPGARAIGSVNAANGLWVLAALVIIPLALLRVVVPRPVPPVMRVVDLLVAAVGIATAAAAVAELVTVAIVGGTLCGAIVVCGGGLLFEVTSGDDRRRVLWLILGFMLTVPTSLLLFVPVGDSGFQAVALGLVAALLSLSLPLATAIALINPRLVEIRAVIRHLTVLTLMFTLVAAVYVGVESTFLALTGDIPSRGVRLVVVVAIAAGFHPMMRWVRTSVEELLFGGRVDPVDTLTRLGTHLAAGSSPPEWLDTLRIALAVPAVALRQDGEIVASSGEFAGSVTAVTELRADAEHVADLVVALPPEHLHLAPTMSAVLNLVAAPLAQALHAARLTEEVRASRGRIVGALEEERRRMRRDLHDGLGPTLTGIAYSVDAAANLLRPAPDEAHRILRQLRDDAGGAIAEIRRIVYGLRPLALDELGLVGAVRQQVSHLRTADGRVLAITLDAPAELPALPAAVEVAAYRVAVEAVTNVARHAGVAAADIRLALLPGPVLRVEVSDRGSSPDPWTPGVGMLSMRERVEQIGGTLTVRSATEGATIAADIPLDVGP